MKPEDLEIHVFENPNQGFCPIDEAFSNGDWYTGITPIDNIPVKINRYAKQDRIVVWNNNTDALEFEIKGQRALLLNELSKKLQDILNIKVIK